MDPNRKRWNERQQLLRKALAHPEMHAQAVELFLDQHAMCHTARISKTGLVSFEDEIWNGLSNTAARWVSPEVGHSIVWNFWHLTRIEDVTMNILLVGAPQLFLKEGWVDRLAVPFRHTGNGMDAHEVTSLSTKIDITSLRAYRAAVGKQTREIVKSLAPGDLAHKIEPARLEKVMAEGAVIEAGRGVIEYWRGLNGGGLLLMPPTRHAILHLNEMLKIKTRSIRNGIA